MKRLNASRLIVLVLGCLLLGGPIDQAPRAMEASTTAQTSPQAQPPTPTPTTDPDPHDVLAQLLRVAELEAKPRPETPETPVPPTGPTDRPFVENAAPLARDAQPVTVVRSPAQASPVALTPDDLRVRLPAESLDQILSGDVNALAGIRHGIATRPGFTDHQRQTLIESVNKLAKDEEDRRMNQPQAIRSVGVNADLSQYRELDWDGRGSRRRSDLNVTQGMAEEAHTFNQGSGPGTRPLTTGSPTFAGSTVPRTVGQPSAHVGPRTLTIRMPPSPMAPEASAPVRPPGGVLMHFDEKTLAQTFKKQGADATLAEIEALEDRLIKARSRVEAFETLRAFKDQKNSDFADCIGKLRKVNQVRVVSLKALVKKLEAHRQRWQDRPADETTIAGLTRIHGFLRHPVDGDLLLVGVVEKGRPPIKVDDLIVGLRSVWREGLTPGCSLDPDPHNFLAPHSSRIMGVPTDSSFAKIMLDADYAMKRIMVKAPGDELAIPGYKTIPDCFDRQDTKKSFNRFWLFPVQPGPREILIGPAGLSAIYEARVQVLTEEMTLSSIGMTGTGKPDRSSELAVQSFTQHYAQVAEKRPIFKELQGLFDIVLLGKLLRLVAPDDPLLEAVANLPYQPVFVRKSYEGLTVTHPLGGGLTLILQGGCDVRLRMGDRSLIEARTQRLVDLVQAVGGKWKPGQVFADLPPGSLALLELASPETSRDGDAERALAAGAGLLAEEKYAEAAAKFTEAIAAVDGFAEAYALRGLARLHAGERMPALLDVGQALQLAPRDVAVRALFYQVFHEAGVKDALKNIDPPTRTELTNHYLRTTIVQLVRKRVEPALKACSRAIDVDPNKSDPYALRAAIMLYQRDFATAEKDAARAIELGGKDLLGSQLRSLRKGVPSSPLGGWETGILEAMLLILSGKDGPTVDLVAALDADDYFRSRSLDPTNEHLRKWASAKPADAKEHVLQLLAIRKLAAQTGELKKETLADLRRIHETQQGSAKAYAAWAIARLGGEPPVGAKTAPERLRDGVLWFPPSAEIVGAFDIPAFTANPADKGMHSFVQMLHLILFNRSRDDFYKLAETVGNIGIDRASFALVLDPDDLNKGPRDFTVRITGQVDRPRLVSFLRKHVPELQIDEKNGPGGVPLTYFRLNAKKKEPARPKDVPRPDKPLVEPEPDNEGWGPIFVLVGDTDFLIVGGGLKDEKDAQAKILETLGRRGAKEPAKWDDYLKTLDPKTSGFVGVELPDKLVNAKGGPGSLAPRRLTVDIVRSETGVAVRALGKMQKPKDAQDLHAQAGPALAQAAEFLKNPDPKDKMPKRWIEVVKKALASVKVDAKGADVEARLLVSGEPFQLTFWVHVLLDQVEESVNRHQRPNDAKHGESTPSAKANPQDDVFRRRISPNNLRQIMNGLHAHHDAFKHFPSAAIVSKKDSKPLLSWRVAILPYIGQDELYRKFKLDEPWDSAHNIKLLAHIPEIYAPEAKSSQPYSTFYQVINDPTAVIFDNSRIRLANITDGLSNTIGVVEAAEAVPWTKPADLVYDKEKRLTKGWNSQYLDGFNAAMMDASVRFFRRDFDERALITRAGNEVVDIDKLTSP